MAIPDWPPQLTEVQRDYLQLQATTHALAHGLSYLPPTPPPLPSVPASAIHAPFTLLPTPFPRKLFSRAHDLMQIYSELYARIALDVEFLDRILNADTAVGRVDDFVGNLWKIWKEVRDEDGYNNTLQLGIFRSDYLLHQMGDAFDIKQVEFNTISSSFGALSQAISQMHRYLLQSTDYFGCSPLLTSTNLPPNGTLSAVVEGLVAAYKAYHQDGLSDDSVILFVSQPNERNVFDQRWLEYELLSTHSIRSVRKTFLELRADASLDTRTRALTVRRPGFDDPLEVSTIYFRAGYTPTDYHSPDDYSTRKMLERSRATKCPSIALQLAGSKKVQCELAKAYVTESILLNKDIPVGSGWSTFTQSNVDDLRESWMDMWGLEEPRGVDWARDRHDELVLKPQREGGGNNVYKANIPPFLETLDEKEREAWIAMELIKVPQGVGNYLVKSGANGSEVVESGVVSELGVFGWALFGGSKDYSAYSGSGGGYLLRTKGVDSDEGGVAAGFSVLDSVLLVD